MHEDEITSLEELKIKAKLTQSVVDTLKSNNCLGALPESEQLSIFCPKEHFMKNDKAA